LVTFRMQRWQGVPVAEHSRLPAGLVISARRLSAPRLEAEHPASLSEAVSA